MIIWHNPKCSTSRKVLGLIRAAGIAPQVRNYLTDPPTRDEIRDALSALGLDARGLIRRKGTPHDDLGLGDPALGDDALIAAMAQTPVLIERPVVFSDAGARIGRPIEAVLDLMPPVNRARAEAAMAAEAKAKADAKAAQA